MKKLLCLASAVLLLGACGKGVLPEAAAVVPTAPSMENMHDNHSVPVPMFAKTTKSAKCVQVPKVTLGTIAIGGVPVKIIISSARAYKPAGKSPYFVAARFTVDGGSEVSQVGVWALSRLKLTDAPRILAVDTVAQKNSSWQKAHHSEARISKKNKNVSLAKSCLKEMK